MSAARLPGEDLVRSGLDDLRCAQQTDAALLVSIATRRLRELGIEVPELPPDPGGVPAELRLYDRLVVRLGRGAAHRRYNSLLERLVAFEDALAGEQARAARRARSATPAPTER